MGLGLGCRPDRGWVLGASTIDHQVRRAAGALSVRSTSSRALETQSGTAQINTPLVSRQLLLIGTSALAHALENMR